MKGEHDARGQYAKAATAAGLGLGGPSLNPNDAMGLAQDLVAWSRKQRRAEAVRSNSASSAVAPMRAVAVVMPASEPIHAGASLEPAMSEPSTDVGAGAGPAAAAT